MTKTNNCKANQCVGEQAQQMKCEEESINSGEQRERKEKRREKEREREERKRECSKERKNLWTFFCRHNE